MAQIFRIVLARLDARKRDGVITDLRGGLEAVLYLCNSDQSLREIPRKCANPCLICIEKCGAPNRTAKADMVEL